MTKRPRFSQPGTLTLTEILGTPSRPLRWLSLSTPNKFRLSPPGSSSSRKNAKSNLPSRPAEPPSVETAGATDTPISDVALATRRALFVAFTILARLTDVRIQPAPRAETISQSHPVAQPCPPIAATVVTSTLPHSRNVQLDVAQLAPPDLPPQSHLVKTPWIWQSMAAQHPLLPQSGRVPLRWTS